MEIGILEKAHKLRYALYNNTNPYQHSAVLANSDSQIILDESKQKHMFTVHYGIKDILLSGALTNSPVLLTGGTDTGKTTLAKLTMNALFGQENDGWHRIDVDTDFGKEAFTDIDYSVITEGKKSSDGFYSLRAFFLKPGLIIDEFNRSHAVLLNKLMHVLDGDISLPDGKRALIGADIGNNQRYQFQIMAINEGEDYTGTFGMDKAARRRALIEIPIDAFPPTSHDKLEIQRSRTRKIDLNNKADNLEDVLCIYKELGNIPVNPNAEMFVSYLSAFDYCKKLKRGKGAVSPEQVRKLCSGDADALDARSVHTRCGLLEILDGTDKDGKELCPNVRGLTPGVAKNTVLIARGLAAIRATKFAELVHGYLTGGQNSIPLSYTIKNPTKFKDSLRNYVDNGSNITDEQLAKQAVKKYANQLEVEIGDIKAALGFVAYSKINISQPYVTKNFGGNKLAAVEFFLDRAEKKFMEGLQQIGPQDLAAVVNGTADKDTLAKIKNDCDMNNPWLHVVLEAYNKPAKKITEGSTDLY